MIKRFFHKTANQILRESTCIEKKNKENRAQVLIQKSVFKKKVTDTQSDIEEIRKSIRKTMR